MININAIDRVRYYFGDFYNQKLTIKVDPELYEFKLDKPFFYKGPNHSEYVDDPRMKPCFWFQHKDFCIDIPCIGISSDGYDNQGLPALTKARQIGLPNNGILMKLNIARHWAILDNAPKDIDWKDKISEVIWRGNHVCGYKKKANRFDLVEKYAYEHNIRFWSGDINKYCSGQHKYYYDHQDFFADRFMKESEQLKYKYLICMEGNDVATGLKWMLNSNSLVIMPKPKVESWLMEGLLVPWEHYIPLNDKLDNLNELLEWCKMNDDECRKIVKNANCFMRQFKNFDDEKFIFDAIVDLYKENISFIL